MHRPGVRPYLAKDVLVLAVAGVEVAAPVVLPVVRVVGHVGPASVEVRELNLAGDGLWLLG